MPVESKSGPTIEETVTHTEYSRSRNGETHIPDVKFAFEGDVPVKLTTKLRTYEVSASKELQPAERFFAHTVERDANGAITVVKFENEQAAMFFGEITVSYRRGAVSSLAKATSDELALAHIEQAGIPKGGVAGMSDRLYKERLIREATTGAAHDPRSEALLLPRDVALTVKRQLERTAETYFPPKMPEIDRKEVKFPTNDWYGDMTQEVLEWIEGLQQTGIEVTVQQTQVKTGQRPFVINNVLLGRVEASPEESFYLEKEVAGRVLFAAETLRMRIRPELYIYNTALFEESTSWRKLTSKLRYFNGTSASHSGGKILISDSATRIVDTAGYNDKNTVNLSTHNKISKYRLRNYITHETGHFVDPYTRVATRPQKEGFAQSMEVGFRFDKALQNLRGDGMGCGREVTPQMLYQILSNEPKGLTQPEIYDVPTTFYCWLYEKLGPDAFKSFYGKLTGGSFMSWGRGLERLKHEIEVEKDKKHFKGNVLHCLDSLPKDHRWTWESPEKLVEEYIADVNRGIPVSTEMISTITMFDRAQIDEPREGDAADSKPRPLAQPD